MEARPPHPWLLPCIALLAAAPAWGREPVSCPSAVVVPDRLEQTRNLREKYFAACLTCEGTRCHFREFTAEEHVFARNCPALFCTPVSIGRAALVPENADDEGRFSFTYAIDARGRVSEVTVTAIEGNASARVARDLVRNAYGRRIYEPIVVGGVTYELHELKDALNFTINR